MDYEKLLPYAAPRQAEYIQAVIDAGGNKTIAAKRLGVNLRNLRRGVKIVENRAARAGYSPDHDMTHTAPDGFHLKGTSTLYDDTGAQRMQWVKTQIDHERQREMMLEAVEAMCQTIPKAKPIKPPAAGSEDLANLFVITDYHLGMLSWAEETREDWDTDIAEDLLVRWFGAAIQAAPKAKTAIFAQLGDFLHYDGLEAVTPTNEHVLDSDTRFQRLVRVAIRVLRRVIQLLLQTHEMVHIIMAEGNHDIASSVWMREIFHAFYQDEPRVQVDRSADIFYCYEHGLTSLFFHHGHKRKPGDIDNVFAAKYREVFGRTKHSYAHMGHMHHIDIKETNLMVVEQHRTLAAADAYSTRLGWMAGRDAKVITYSKQYGEVGRITISPDMVKN